MTGRTWIVGAALAALTGVASGCASSNLSAEEQAYGAGSAEMAVRGFLDAAAVRGYTQMAHLFGTSKGPAERQFGVDEVEQRMIVLARLLEHQSYTLREPELRLDGPDSQWFVAQMVGTRKGTVDVPILSARTSHDRWFVQEIDVGPLTRDQ